jgi:hypothetical protein
MNVIRWNNVDRLLKEVAGASIRVQKGAAE